MPALIYPLLSYQGRLVENGEPITGTRSMTFSLWSASASGAKVWEEGPEKVVVTNGLFTATLGDTMDLPVSWFAYELWLEVQVGANILPRQRLMGAPYAMSLAPGAQVFDSTSSSDPAIVTIENAGAGVALTARSGEGRAVDAESGSGIALYASSSGSQPTLQVTSTGTTGRAAEIASNGSLCCNGGQLLRRRQQRRGVLRLMTTAGAPSWSRTSPTLSRSYLLSRPMATSPKAEPPGWSGGDLGLLRQRIVDHPLLHLGSSQAFRMVRAKAPARLVGLRSVRALLDRDRPIAARCGWPIATSLRQFNCMRTGINGGIDGPLRC
jgi:hypothetical protein